jgi:hypothetical protein
MQRAIAVQAQMHTARASAGTVCNERLPQAGGLAILSAIDREVAQGDRAMTLFTRTLAFACLVAVFPRVAAAVPPQPALTNATLAKWNAERIAIRALEDNAFLQEESRQEFSRQLAAWQHAPVLLHVQVSQVTKKAVLCAPPVGFRGISVSHARESPARIEGPDVGLTLRIGDVVPLDVARRLRAGDQLVLRGQVESCGYQSEAGGLHLAVGKGEVTAVVARTFEKDAQR